MKHYYIPLGHDDMYLEVKRNQIDSGLPFIRRRLYHAMPLELIDVDEMSKVIDYIHVNVSRDCTPEEVKQLVEQIKNLLRDALDGIPHYIRDAGERGRYHVP